MHEKNADYGDFCIFFVHFSHICSCKRQNNGIMGNGLRQCHSTLGVRTELLTDIAKMIKYYDKSSSENRLKSSSRILVSNTQNFSNLYFTENQTIRKHHTPIFIKRHQKNGLFCLFLKRNEPMFVGKVS